MFKNKRKVIERSNPDLEQLTNSIEQNLKFSQNEMSLSMQNYEDVLLLT